MDTCPNCGYCKHCGRGGHQVYPITPYPPYYAGGWWGIYPPHWTGNVVSGTWTTSQPTVGNTTATYVPGNTLSA
jgi:hypothetical protein